MKLVAAVLAVLSVPVLAQTGPWTDGELIVRSFLPPPGQVPAFFRINPENGDGETLVSGFSFWGWSGGYTFDRHRDAVLANISFPSSNSYLYEISSSGVATAIPGFDFKPLRGLASAGDGRVFFQPVPPTPSIPGNIQWLDANDAVHTLLDAAGTAPLSLHVEHMIWHAASNAIIATTSTGAPGSCNASGPSVYRIPLSADGTKVEGGVSCAGFGNGFKRNTSLDVLPSGEVLMTLAINSAATDPAKLLPVSPLTLAVGGTLAGVDPALLHGGHWNERIGRFVVLDNGLGNVLRKYSQGESGNGTVLATDVPVNNGLGFAPVDCLVEVRDPLPGCTGSAVTVGVGLAGASGFVPNLTIIGCPEISSSFLLGFDAVLGQVPGLLFVGVAPGALPFKGGTLHMAAVLASFAIAVGGPPAAPGLGTLALPALITDPALAGVSLYLQAAFADGAAIHGASLSNARKVTLGS